jgi:hypothetical protein
MQLCDEPVELVEPSIFCIMWGFLEADGSCLDTQQRVSVPPF